MILILTIHSVFRWLVVLVALAAIIRLALGLARNLPFDRSAGILVAALTGFLDLQALIGLFYFLLDGFSQTGFPTYRWEHVGFMVAAIATAHSSARWRQADDRTRTRNTLIVFSLSLLLIILGVGIPLGWPRWLHVTGLF